MMGLPGDVCCVNALYDYECDCDHMTPEYIAYMEWLSTPVSKKRSRRAQHIMNALNRMADADTHRWLTPPVAPRRPTAVLEDDEDLPF
jgi:hypothetical protein